MNIGKAIKLCRKAKCYTQSDLAKFTKLSISYISLLERNKRDINITVLEILSKAFGISIIILIFLAADNDDLSEFGNNLTNKLNKLITKIINNTD